MRWTLSILFLASCSNDVFVSGDGGGSDATTSDASQPDAGVIDGGASDAAVPCEVDATTNCGNCAASCCVSTQGAACSVCSNSGFTLSCRSPADCIAVPTTDGGQVAQPICCLDTLDVTLKCPREINPTSGESTCLMTCTGTRLCSKDSDCPSQRCSHAVFEIDTSVTIGVCDP